MDKGIIQIYYGEGQGKTSAALGNAIRKASNGQSAYVVQFMKGQLDTEYLTRLEPEVKVFRFERCSEGFDALDEAEKQEQKQKAETQKEEVNVAKEEPKVQETASKPSALTFKGELAWPAAEEDKVIMNYSMDQTVYFKSLDQYRYNPAVIIGAKVNDKVTSAAAGSVLDVSNNEVTGCTVTVNLGDGYKAIYGQLKEVSKKAGDYVAPGEVIGYISEPTKYYSEEGSNLYFELQKDDQPVDPMGYFK